MVADIGLGLLTVFVFILAITFVAHIFLKTPFIPTPKILCREMIRLADFREGDIVYDLGAGDGRLLIMAKRACPEIVARGYEVVPTIWFLGKVCTWVSKENVELRCQNLFAANLRDADTVFLYLIPSHMRKLEEKFARELRPGTKIISHGFSLPSREPTKVLQVPCGRRVRKVLLYEW